MRLLVLFALAGLVPAGAMAKEPAGKLFARWICMNPPVTSAEDCIALGKTRYAAASCSFSDDTSANHCELVNKRNFGSDAYWICAVVSTNCADSLDPKQEQCGKGYVQITPTGIDGRIMVSADFTNRGPTCMDQRSLHHDLGDDMHIVWNCSNPPVRSAADCFARGKHEYEANGCQLSGGAKPDNCYTVMNNDDHPWFCNVLSVNCTDAARRSPLPGANPCGDAWDPIHPAGDGKGFGLGHSFSCRRNGHSGVEGPVPAAAPRTSGSGG
jgi:hypothetical protein